MNVFKKVWYWIRHRAFRNTGCELLKITGDDWVYIQQACDYRDTAPVKIMADLNASLLVGPFPVRQFGKMLYVDAGKNKVERIKVKKKR